MLLLLLLLLPFCVSPAALLLIILFIYLFIINQLRFYIYDVFADFSTFIEVVGVGPVVPALGLLGFFFLLFFGDRFDVDICLFPAFFFNDVIDTMLNSFSRNFSRWRWTFTGRNRALKIGKITPSKNWFLLSKFGTQLIVN